MDEQTNLDAGINASEDEETTATDGIMSEDTETTLDVDTEDLESEDEIDQEAKKKKKNAEKVKKILAEKNALTVRIAELEKRDAIKDLRLKFWDFDEQKVIEIKDKHPTLSYEEAFMLNDKQNPQVRKEPQVNLWITGRETTSLTKSTITMKELTNLDPMDYKAKYAEIQSGKIILVQ